MNSRYMVCGNQKVADMENPNDDDMPGAGEGISNGCDDRQPGPIVRQVPGLSKPMTSLTGSRKNAAI